jgi:4a-hydroxytetrahydrobiopterin dehydratase
VKEPRLTDDELAAALRADDAPDWHLVGDALIKTVVSPTFPDALAFVARVGELAEERNHHPDIDIRYTKVTLALVTHDSGGITRLDLELARAIDQVVAAPPA